MCVDVIWQGTVGPLVHQSTVLKHNLSFLEGIGFAHLRQSFQSPSAASSRQERCSEMSRTASRAHDQRSHFARVRLPSELAQFSTAEVQTLGQPNLACGSPCHRLSAQVTRCACSPRRTSVQHLSVPLPSGMMLAGQPRSTLSSSLLESGLLMESFT